MENNLLYKYGKNKGRLIIPSEIEKEFIMEIHNAYGHLGRNKIYNMMKDTFYCKNLFGKILEIIKCCDICQREKYTVKYLQGERNIYTKIEEESL